jgi:hypothetical protein
VVQLLTAAADLGLQTPLLTQLEVLMQVTNAVLTCSSLDYVHCYAVAHKYRAEDGEPSSRYVAMTSDARVREDMQHAVWKLDTLPAGAWLVMLLTRVLFLAVLAMSLCWLQITYLQVGALAVTGAWSPSPLKSDAVRVGAQFRSEVHSLIQAVTTGQFTQQDLAAASQLLANVASQRDDAASLQFGDEEDGGMDAEGPSGSSSSGNARVLMDLLLRRPMGEVLLSYAAVPNSSWGPNETEYGT